MAEQEQGQGHRFPPQELKTAIRRLELCSYAVQEIHIELGKPQDPEDKADLLIASENLASEVLDLLTTVRAYVWGVEQDEQVYYSDDQ